MNLEGISTIVTGGASGMGEATVRMLVARGASCAVIDVDEKRGHHLESELKGSVTFVAGDVADPATITTAINAVRSVESPLRVAVNCAGVGLGLPLLDDNAVPHDLERFMEVVRVNLVGSFNVLRLVAAEMATSDPTDEGERGVIINTSSAAALDGHDGSRVAYSSSKAAVGAMTLPAARGLAHVGIRVLCIAPGLMETPLVERHLDEVVRNQVASAIPFPQRLGRPSEFADLVEVGCRSLYLNGAHLRLDGAFRVPSAIDWTTAPS